MAAAAAAPNFQGKDTELNYAELLEKYEDLKRLPPEQWCLKDCEGCRKKCLSCKKQNATEEEARRYGANRFHSLGKLVGPKGKKCLQPRTGCDRCAVANVRKAGKWRKKRLAAKAKNPKEKTKEPYACSCGHLYQAFKNTWHTYLLPTGEKAYRSSCPPCINRRDDNRKAQIALAEALGCRDNLCLRCVKQKPFVQFLAVEFNESQDPFEVELDLVQEDTELSQELRRLKAESVMSMSSRERFATCIECRSRDKEIWHMFAEKLRVEKETRLASEPNEGECIGPSPFPLDEWGAKYNRVPPLRAKDSATAAGGNFRDPCLSNLSSKKEVIPRTPYLCCIEYDHRDPRSKYRAVSKIRQDWLRHSEQEVCDLRCTLCHREKGQRANDHGAQTSPEWRKDNPTDCMREKKQRYDLTKCVGQTILGPTDDEDRKTKSRKKTGDQEDVHSKPPCLFAQELDDFFEVSTGRAFYEVLEYDHRERTAKIKHVGNIEDPKERHAEQRKCDLRCCFDHKIKSWWCGDWGRIFGGRNSDPNAPVSE